MLKMWDMKGTRKKYQTGIKFIDNVGHEWDTKNYDFNME